ncbi:hypothetical protein SCP_0500430 [Sparassis crispa]|uniref:F-box domain-containing protein n=1 Tax=Sparassis crispa TaxID=139825 RepID=A0A401GLG1_9APHY|nr:hypothetical protein SCP_0500430 [Sparassis crispa]GBE83000.1 hypothetical protein SCP_0500430 [Sparassis crispa]
MDNLVTLAVNLPGMMHAETVTCDFPCLRTLEVAGELQTITRFLEAVSSPCLEELVIKVPTSTSAPVAENYRQCFEVLRTRFSASLESIVFQGTRNAWNADSPSLPAASKQILEPLLCIHQLKRLELTFPRTIPLELTNEDVQAMALSWPRVTVLDIYYPGPVSAVYPSVYSLISFASHCPKLHTVSLPCLDTPAVPSLGLPAPPVCWHGLQELLIPNQLVSVTDADSVACFLDCLFPCLDVTSLGSEECLGDQWECVRRKMYYLQKSRSMMPVVG